MSNKKFNLFKAATIVWENNTNTSEKLKKLERSKNIVLKRSREEAELAKNYKTYIEVRELVRNMPHNSKSPAITTARNTLSTEVQTYRQAIRHNKEFNTINVTVGAVSRPLSLNTNTGLKLKKTLIIDTINVLLKDVRKQREDRKLTTVHRTVQERFRQFSNKAFGSLHCEIIGKDNIGFVHAKTGSIIKLQNAKVIKRIFEAKLPKTSENHVGVEIEFYCAASQSLIAEKLVDINQYLCLKSDGSIHAESGNSGHELVICVPERKREEVINKVCAVLNELKAKVNGSCGLHVHVDMRNRNHELAFHNLVTSLPVLYAMNPKGRQTGQYSKKNTSKVFSDHPNGSARYWGVNPQSYYKYKTLEIRLHAGSTNATKINNWVTILNSIADKKEEVKRGTENVKKFASTFNIPDTLVSYIEERIQRFENTEEVDAA